LDKISAETCLKRIILEIKSPNRQTLGTQTLFSQTPIYIKQLENVQDPTPIEHFWLMQILVIWG